MKMEVKPGKAGGGRGMMGRGIKLQTLLRIPLSRFLALPLTHLWVHLWADRVGGALHSPGMTRQIRLQYPGAII
jgi:hypothetical protein